MLVHGYTRKFRINDKISLEISHYNNRKLFSIFALKPSDQSEEPLFQRCLDLPPDEWESFLNATCAGNEALKHRVIRLLKSHQNKGGFLDAVKDGTSPPSTPLHGEKSLDLSENQAPETKPIRWKHYGIGLVLLGLGAYVFLGIFPMKNSPEGLAVLPFEILISEGIKEPFSTGLHEELVKSLTTVSDLGLHSNFNSADLSNDSKTLPRLGEALNAQYLVLGDIQSTGKQVRIHAQLVDALNDETLWSQSYTRKLIPQNQALLGFTWDSSMGKEMVNGHKPLMSNDLNSNPKPESSLSSWVLWETIIKAWL